MDFDLTKLKSNPELLKLLMDSKNWGTPSASTAGAGLKYSPSAIKLGPEDLNPDNALHTLSQLTEAIKQAHAPEPPELKPLSAEDFADHHSSNFKADIGAKRAAMALRRMADRVEAGQYMISSVQAASEAKEDEFPTHSLVINYGLNHKP